jgi:putative DNA primase/helicase
VSDVVDLEARRARKRKPKPGEKTEIEIGEMVIARFGSVLRYCAARGGWHYYDGKRWQCDDLERARECVKTIARELAAEAGALMDDELYRAGKRASSASGIADVMRSDKRLVVAPTAFDSDPWLLNCRNGTIDLRTGELRPHDADDLISKLADVDYDPDAKAETFDTFLSTVQPSDAVRAYLARLFGYACVGLVRDHVLAVLWGPGANGKSVFNEIVMCALGEYAGPAPSSLLVDSATDPHPTDTASLFGKRLAGVHETKRGARFDASRVKLLTGGDRLVARFMHKNFFDFPPSHTLVLVTNYKPEIDGTDAAAWRRIQLIPFPVVIPVEQRDVALTEKIRGELPGVLRWLVDGCREWQRIGLAPPPSVLEQTARYRESEDNVAAFIEARCSVSSSLKCRASVLYEAFAAWCKSTGAKAASGRHFGEEMVGRGYERRETNAGRVYDGIGLRADADEGSDRGW